MDEQQQTFLERTRRQKIEIPDGAFGVVVAMTSQGLKVPVDRFESIVSAINGDLRANWRAPIDDVEAARRTVLHNAGINGRTHKWVKLPDVTTGTTRTSTRWALLRTEADGDEAKGEHVGRIELDTSGPANVFDVSDLPDTVMRDEIMQAFAVYRANFLTPDLTEGFAKLCMAAKAVQWGGHGHLYFVPPDALPIVQQGVDIVRDAVGRSVVVWWFPCLSDDDSHVEVAREAVNDDLDSTITQVESWIKTADERERGATRRGLAARLEDVVAAKDKLALYEGLLAFKADGLRQRIDQLNDLIPLLIRVADH